MSLEGNTEEQGRYIYAPLLTPSVCTGDSFHPGPSIDLALPYCKGRILPQEVKLYRLYTKRNTLHIGHRLYLLKLNQRISLFKIFNNTLCKENRHELLRIF